MSLVDQRIEEWKRKIVDLSRRNRLLFFSPTRGSTLRVVEPSLTEVFERLVNSEAPWEFCMPPDAPDETNESESELAGTQPHSDKVHSINEPDELGEASTQSAFSDRNSDELLTDIEDGKKLRNILRNLYRRSRTDFEERGVRILFLTFGVLEWKEVEQSEIIKSPILLVPVELKRESVNDPFQLHPVDEEIVINPALAVKLGDDFKIELPPIPEDWDSVSLEKFLEGFRDQVGKYGWTLRETSWLGLFSFHKLVIYHDLKNHAALLGAHSVVRCLCEEEKEPISTDPPDPQELDMKTSPDTSFLVADADSSQLVCIEAVKSGSNLVIQGPPGTGKSQTITNLISEFIARGKSVLFVSEKMAALEVVFQRLQNANLGHFCLQLHSHRANKREVIQELYKTYGEQLQPKKGLTEFEVKQLMERRKKLNDYVHSLHLIRRPLGYSAFDGLGRATELEGVLYISAGTFDASQLTPESLDGAEQLASRLEPMWYVAIAGPDFPWFGCTLTIFTLTNKAALQVTLRECTESLEALRAATSLVSEQLGLDSPTYFDGVDWLLETSRLLKHCPGIEKHWILGSELDEIGAETERYLGLSRNHEENRTIIDSLYTAEFLSLPSDLRDRLRTALDELCLLTRRALDDDPSFVTNRNLFLEWVHDCSSRLSNWDKDGQAIQQSLGLHGSLNTKRLRQLVRIEQICESDYRADESWLEITKLRAVSQALPSIRERFEKRNREQRALFAEYEAGVLELDCKELIERFSGPYSSFFRIFRPGYYKARARIRRLRKNGQLPHSILTDLRRIQSLKDLENQLLREFPQFKELLGACFRGFETDFGHLGKAVSNAQELLELANVQPLPNQFVRQASAQGLATLDLRNVAAHLNQSMEEWERELPLVKQYLPADLWDGSGVALDERPLNELRSWAVELGNAVGGVCELLTGVLSCARSPEGLTCHRLMSDLIRLGDLRKIEAEIFVESGHLTERFGKRFNGIQTSWTKVLEAVQWTSQFKSHFGNRPIPEILLNVVVLGKDKAPDRERLVRGLNRCRAAFQQLSRDFAEGFPAVGGAPILEADFAGISTRLQDMLEQIEALRDWIDLT